MKDDNAKIYIDVNLDKVSKLICIQITKDTVVSSAGDIDKTVISIRLFKGDAVRLVEKLVQKIAEW